MGIHNIYFCGQIRNIFIHISFLTGALLTKESQNSCEIQQKSLDKHITLILLVIF